MNQIVKKIVLAVFALFILQGIVWPFIGNAQSKKEIYEWRVYKLKDGGAAVIDEYFENILIPAYNRKGVKKVGAFKLYKSEDVELRYLMFTYPDIETFKKINGEVWKDKAFMEAAKPFFDKTAVNEAYSEYETYLCEAFDFIPKMRTPDKDRTLFELRIYHAPNYEAFLRKVHMFNNGEINIFDAVGVNSVNYGAIMAGPMMPALMYLTWYKDQPARDAAWKAFGEHPEWQRMAKDPQYANSHKGGVNRLLSPMSYSQF